MDIELRFYRERYNMDDDYCTGDKDIYARLYFKDLNDLKKKWKSLFNVNKHCLEGETYSAWYDNRPLCYGAFDPDDIDIILKTQTMARKKLYDTKTKLVLSLEMIVGAENPDDAKLVAKEAAHELPRLLTEDLTEEEKMFALSIYVAGWDEDCIDVKEMEE